LACKWGGGGGEEGELRCGERIGGEGREGGAMLERRRVRKWGMELASRGVGKVRRRFGSYRGGVVGGKCKGG